MSFEPHARLPLAAFPLPALAATDLDDADTRPPNVATPAGFRGCHYIMAVGKELWHKAYRSSFHFEELAVIQRTHFCLSRASCFFWNCMPIHTSCHFIQTRLLCCRMMMLRISITGLA